jgi:Kef-type K+ transport system membrane component KefB
MSHSRKPFDPVILVALGIALITFSVILIAMQNQSDQALAIGVGSGFWGRISVAFVTGMEDRQACRA